MPIPKLLQTTRQQWQERVGVAGTLTAIRNALLRFEDRGGNISDLAVAKSYMDELYNQYLEKETKNGSV